MEEVLLDPIITPELRVAYILVEVHDFIYPNVGQIISARFQETHGINEIVSKARTFEDFPIKLLRNAVFIPKKYIVESIYERRPGKMRWFYLEPKMQGERK